MFRYNEPETVGQVLGDFKQYTKEELATQLVRKFSNIKLDSDGMAVCKKCGQPRMFHYVGYGKDCYFPIICRCEGEDIERKKLDELCAENRAASGIYGARARMNFDNFPICEANKPAYRSALNYCKNFDKVRERGQGLYLYGATGTGKTFLAVCVANFLLDVGVKVKFVEACDVLFPVGNGNLYNASGRNANEDLIAECIGAELLIFDNLGGDVLTANNNTNSAAQRRLARIIDGRYGKSTVFTSNFNLKDLTEQCGIKANTVDRMREMATRAFELGERSHRFSAALPDIAF